MAVKTDRWRALRTVKRKERKKVRRFLVRQGRIYRKVNAPQVLDQVWLATPSVFALDGVHHDGLVHLLRKMREAFKKGDRTVCLDFRSTTKMIAGGTLLFHSELHRLVEMFPAVAVRCIPSKDPIVNQVLAHLRIFSLLGHESSVIPRRHDVTSWRTASSAEVDGEKVGEMLLKYASLTGPIAGKLFRGAGEAMFNVRHAYLADRNDGLPEPSEKKWWMFCQETKDSIAVAVCDLGIGIPRSLPIKYPSELIASLVSKLPGAQLNNDAKMIHAAMQIRRTSTDLQGRGKGLNDFLSIIDYVPKAKLYIFSNRGLVKYDGDTFRQETYENSIKGTVVIWVIPLHKNGE